LWARACQVDQRQVLARAKDLLPDTYPERFLPPTLLQPPQPSLEAHDWHTAGPASASDLVGRALSLIREAESKGAPVVLTSTGPFMSALAATAGNGSVIDPVSRDLAEHMKSGGAVSHLWSVDGTGSHGPDWLRLIRDLLGLSGFDVLYQARISLHRDESPHDLLAVRDVGGLLILGGVRGVPTAPVSGPEGAAALFDHFEVLTQRNRSMELFCTFDFSDDPRISLAWEQAMADADEAPGWRMLVQPQLGLMTIPASVHARMIARWRETCSDLDRIELSLRFEEIIARRRVGFELSLLQYDAYDIVSGPAFDRFIDSGIRRESGMEHVEETSTERLEHLDYLIALLANDKYHLVIVNRRDDIYPELFSGDDEAAPVERELHRFLLKERGSDFPSVFTSTYFPGHKARAFEIRHPRIVAAYRGQADAILANLSRSLTDKERVIATIRAAMQRIARAR
jgi:hypothetical protein